VNSRERLLATLNHQEPDCIPFDLGSTQVTGIHVVAYRNLRDYLGLPRAKPTLCDTIQQLALPDDDVIERLGVDVRGFFPFNSRNWNIVNHDAGEYWAYTDEWGITHHRPKPDGLYYSMVHSPLADAVVTQDDIRAHKWPHTADPQRIVGLREQALAYRAQGRAVVIKGVLAGIFEMAQRVRGMENLLMDMAANESLAGVLLDKMLELKLAFWEMALPQLADVVDVISEADDYGTQTSQLISPRMFRQQIKPRLKTLFARLKQLAPCQMAHRER
jgi:uroporphyrinogen decarboxylase